MALTTVLRTNVLHYDLTFKFQKGRGLGSRDAISKFWDPLITLERIEISPSNLLKWAWPRSRDQISKFWDPLITLEGIEVCVLQIWHRHRR